VPAQVNAPHDPARLDALGPAGPFRSRTPASVRDVRGNTVAELSMVPALFVSRALLAMRRARPLPPRDRVTALHDAAHLFTSATLAGLGPADYQHLVSRVAGLSPAVIRQSAGAIAESCRNATRASEPARPLGVLPGPDDAAAAAGGAIWAGRGRLLGVHAAGNHPAVHCHWLEALALGYTVAVRPSRREPFTAHRLVSALRESGFGPDQVAFLPTDHEAADEMISAADLSVVYGGDDVVRKYAGDPAVLTNGPGRSKILLTAAADWRRHLDLLADSVSHGGGTGCVATTAIYLEGDPAPLAHALAGRLSALPSLPPEDERAVLPVLPGVSALRISDYLAASAGDAVPVLGGNGIADDLHDGSAALRPAVHLLSRPDAPQARIELPFPCVWVGPWTPDAGVGPLRDTLVLTVIGAGEPLVDELLAEPTIRNLYVGPVPTYWTGPAVPHDDYLAAFLMRSKGFTRREARAAQPGRTGSLPSQPMELR
jgi:acyl-CoA reductase-like NAD-dependent aldehyde dehydrogenase